MLCCRMPMASAAPPQIHEDGLRHQLSASQMAMVAVGGSIGTGLLLGSGAAMEIAGPAAILSFLAATFVNWTVEMALGELHPLHPPVNLWSGLTLIGVLTLAFIVLRRQPLK